MRIVPNDSGGRARVPQQSDRVGRLRAPPGHRRPAACVHLTRCARSSASCCFWSCCPSHSSPSTTRRLAGASTAAPAGCRRSCARCPAHPKTTCVPRRPACTPDCRAQPTSPRCRMPLPHAAARGAGRVGAVRFRSSGGHPPAPAAKRAGGVASLRGRLTSHVRCGASQEMLPLQKDDALTQSVEFRDAYDQVLR